MSGFNLFEELEKRGMDDLLAEFGERWAAAQPDLGKVEHQQLWNCEDGWVVGYTTTRVVGGPHDGKFLVLAYRPVGKGARSGNPEEVVLNYQRSFAVRKKARARAIELYLKHCPSKKGQVIV